MKRAVVTGAAGGIGRELALELARRRSRVVLADIDPELALSDVQTMSQRAVNTVVTQKLATGLAALFGAVALFLSTVGVYGVLTYLVVRRTREVGIRIALGGSSRDIFQLFFTEGLALVGSGVATGVAVALVFFRERLKL